MRDTDRQDQERRQDQNEAERAAFTVALLARGYIGGVQSIGFDAVDMSDIMVRQAPGPVEPPGNLQEAEAHQPGAERQRQIYRPHRPFEIVRLLAGLEHFPDKRAAEHGDDAGEKCTTEQAEHDHPLARSRGKQVDEDVDADVDARPHAISGAELRHPDEHVNAEFLRPGQIQRREPKIQVLQHPWHDGDTVRVRPFRQIDRDAGAVAMQHSDENQQRRRRNQRGDEPLFQMVERPIEPLEHAQFPQSGTNAAGSPEPPAVLLIVC